MSIVDNADFIRWLLNFDRSNPLDSLPSEETLGPLPDGFAFIDWEPNDRVARRRQVPAEDARVVARCAVRI